MKDVEAIPASAAVMDRQAILETQLAELRQRHRALDEEIAAIAEAAAITGSLEVRRLKKQKLALKDAIAKIEDQLLPDIIA